MSMNYYWKVPYYSNETFLPTGKLIALEIDWSDPNIHICKHVALGENRTKMLWVQDPGYVRSVCEDHPKATIISDDGMQQGDGEGITGEEMIAIMDATDENDTASLGDVFC